MGVLVVVLVVFVGAFLLIRGRWSFALLLLVRSMSVLFVVPYVQRTYAASGVGSDALFYQQQVALVHAGDIRVPFSWTGGTNNIIALNAGIQGWLHLTPTDLTILLQVPVVLLTLRVWLALRNRVPDAVRAFALILLGWVPSAIFWTSTYGKDVWVYLGGLMMLSGAIHLYFGSRKQRPSNIALFVLGAFFVSLFKPYIAFALLAGFLFRFGMRIGRTRKVAHQSLKLILFVCLLLIAYLLEKRSLGTGSGSLLQQFGAKADLLSSGGSSLSLGSSSSISGIILRIPLSLAATLFRPWPLDVHSGFILIETIEVMAFWITCLRTVSRLRKSPPDQQTLPLVQLGRVGAIALLVLGVSLAPVVGNLGTLARIRVFDAPYLALLPIYLTALVTRRKPADTPRLGRDAPSTPIPGPV